ncbi:nitroreductase family protein [Solimonas variicoloris]|uniref:nitroreductase family protein n=1 Tax=Solimonas variicoloris TaxID=254408 RepID=UPI000361FD3A|nr:nitroreductase family protein [Solimonas variicoloris]
MPATADTPLPPPRLNDCTLRDALRLRRSTRAFGPQPLSDQALSDLLWAACGVNRADTAGRTAPSARHWQEIDVYAALRGGLYRYEPATHALRRVIDADLRALSGEQDFVGAAPLNLVYVADLSRVDAGDEQERRFYTAADAGFIAQNVYLCCAAIGLVTVVCGLVDRRRLAAAMGLRAEQRVLLAQTIGHPP